MTCYVVTFEPIGEGARTAIRQQLKTLPRYCPIHAFCWAVMCDMTAVQLRDSLIQASPESKFFVVRSGTEAAWTEAYGPKNTEWLKANL
jgi:hypothetical protein